MRILSEQAQTTAWPGVRVDLKFEQKLANFCC